MRFEDLGQDLTYAIRGLRAKPGFALAVVVTLGLGIGANAAMFGIVDRLLFRPPPMLKDPATAHRIYTAETHRGKERAGGVGRYARFTDLSKWTTLLRADGRVHHARAGRRGRRRGARDAHRAGQRQLLRVLRGAAGARSLLHGRRGPAAGGHPGRRHQPRDVADRLRGAAGRHRHADPDRAHHLLDHRRDAARLRRACGRTSRRSLTSPSPATRPARASSRGARRGGRRTAGAGWR